MNMVSVTYTYVVDTGVKWGIRAKRGSVKIDLCRVPKQLSSHWLERSRDKSQIHACGFHVCRAIHELEVRERFLTTSILFFTFSICFWHMLLCCLVTYKVYVVTVACCSLLRQCSLLFLSTCWGAKWGKRERAKWGKTPFFPHSEGTSSSHFPFLIIDSHAIHAHNHWHTFNIDLMGMSCCCFQIVRAKYHEITSA